MSGGLILRQNKVIDFLTFSGNGVHMFMRIFKGFIFFFFALMSVALYAQPSADAGKTIFRNYCGACHAKDMKGKATGPALAGFQDRWSDYPEEDLYAWVRNSQVMIRDGHPRANELWDEWKSVMTGFPNLTDEDIASVFLYINETAAGPVDGPSPGEVAVQTEANYNWLYWILFGLLAVLALVLAKIIGGLDRVVASNEGEDYVEIPLMKRIFSKRNMSFLTFATIVIGGYFTVTNATHLGRQQNYEPEQPIAFSHETHAGINQIECQYCHDGARRSKHSVIPAANTCMNCHSAIQVGTEYGTAELTKIYASIGYDPSADNYIENYNSLDEDQIKEIYTKWITDNYLETNSLDALDRKGERLVESQWDGIVSSLTNDQKTKIQGPIEWIRIHNLPDFVYFNHAQHVSVGQVECQDCHGKVEEMKVVKQHSPLSMGWCVNCHRKTEVKFEGNDYYASYEAYHKQLAKGDKEKITVEDIGGLECQKCHY